MRIRRNKGGRAVFVGVLTIAIGLVYLSWVNSDSSLRKPTGYPQLVSIQELPDLAVILDATEPLGRNSAHYIHEAAFAETLRPEPSPDTAPGKAVKTKIDEPIVEFFPAVT